MQAVRSMKVQYACECTPSEVTVEVRDRQEGEDIVHWLESVVMIGIAHDHNTRSPNCNALAVKYVKIVVPEAAPFIGGKPKVN